MSRISYPIFALLLAITSGCVSVKSNVDPSFDGPLRTIFVVAQGRDALMNPISNALKTHLGTQQIQVEYYVVEELGLEGASSIKERITTADLDATLIIAQSTQSYYNGAPSGAGFELALVPRATDKPVWRASVSSNTGGFGSGDPYQIAGEIVERMRKDGLFRSQTAAEAASH